MKRLFVGLAVAAALVSPAVAQDEWRTPDPQDVIVVDTNKGRIIAELSPLAAPAHAERIRVLTRQGFYDGLKFFRVIDDFMAQTGDRLNNGSGDSDLPNVPIELDFRRGAETPFAAATSSLGHTGFIGALPVRSQPDGQMLFNADGKVGVQPLFCPGVLGMARAQDLDSANSQFFFMRQAYPRLNGRYTAFGRVLSGLDVVRSIKTGEPVAQPQDEMTRVRILADIPEAERPQVQVMDTRSPAFAALVEQAKAAAGANFDVCTVDIPVRVQ